MGSGDGKAAETSQWLDGRPNTEGCDPQTNVWSCLWIADISPLVPSISDVGLAQAEKVNREDSMTHSKSIRSEETLRLPIQCPAHLTPCMITLKTSGRPDLTSSNASSACSKANLFVTSRFTSILPFAINSIAAG
jgi:hypothetical protein